MFNPILKAEMMYGLETVDMNTIVLAMLNTFQLRCLRNILKVRTAYADREISNAMIKQKINEHLASARKKPLVMLTDYHKQARITYLAKLIQLGHREPSTAVTVDPQTLAEIHHGNKNA